MAKKIEYQVPTKDGTQTRVGVPMLATIGGKRVKLVLQMDDGAHASCLVHYASGYVLSRGIQDAKVRHFVRVGTYGKKMTDREAAKAVLASLIEKNGADRVLAVMTSAPVLNA